MKSRKDQLFQIFSSNLNYYHKDLLGKFACPTCLRVFDSSSDLTKAHVFPKRLGGRLFTLTCKPCNSRIGTEIEAYETERARIHRIFQGNSADSVQVGLQSLECNGIVSRVNAELKVLENDEGKIFRFDIFADRSNPSEVKRITQWLQEKAESGGHDWGFNMNFQARAGLKRAKLTYLHAAFLYMFHQFGYEWALDSCTKDIREQLIKPAKTTIKPLIIEFTDIPGDSNRLKLLLITEPVDLRGFFITMLQLDHIQPQIGVWMPLFGQAYKSNCQVSETKVNFIIVPSLTNQLAQRDAFLFGHKMIKYYFG